MSVSILRDGKLWGLFACHHYSPRHISFERRTAAELFGQMFSWTLETREREATMAYESRAHQIQERLIEAAAGHVIGQIERLSAEHCGRRAAIHERRYRAGPLRSSRRSSPAP